MRLTSSSRQAGACGIRWAALGGLLAALACGLLAGACSMPPGLRSTLFEYAPPPGQDAPPEVVVRKPRRPAYKPEQAVPLPEIVEEPPRPDWLAMRERLPKDATGNVDWARSLKEKLIEPKPGIDPKVEDEPELDLDVELVPKEAADFKATYPHKIHTQMLACANCHTAIFQMEKGADPITMEKIFAGEYCGRCHGKVAFEVATGCPRCHLGMPR